MISKPGFSRRRVICGTDSVRNVSENAVGPAARAAAFDELLVEGGQTPRAILPHRLDERDVRAAAARLASPRG